jgi:hypothetical protein
MNAMREGIAGRGALGVAEDRTASPYTGWVRAHWEAQADLLLDAVQGFASPGFSRIALPGRASVSGADSDALEGFARTFLLAAFRIAGARGAGARAQDLTSRYASGLAAGSDQAHPEAWPRISGDRPSQPMVEAASIAIALHVTRPWLWDQLDDRVRQNVAGWLGGFLGRETVQNNWMLFQTVVEEFLCSVGAPYREPEIMRGLTALESWHLGGGWYTDGAGRRIDYYNGWALHLYPLLWADLAAGGPRSDLAAALSASYRSRLADFLGDYVYLIGGDGAPVHQGRSLTYRFAAAAPLWAGALFGCTPLEPGLTRRAATGMLRYFAGHGAPGPDGRLSLGWHGEFLPMTQDYSGPASPYWASKGFLGLLLPPEHPVWQDTELPLPAESHDTVRALPDANWLVQVTAADGVVRLHNHGSDGLGPGAEVSDDPHYARIAYSTHCAPRTGAGGALVPADNHLALVAPDGTATARGRIHPLGVNVTDGTGEAASWHEPLPGVRIETRTLAAGRLEIRLHSVTAPEGWIVCDGGYSVAAPRRPGTRTGSRWAAAERDDRLCSAMVALHGFDAVGLSFGHRLDAMGTESALPYLTGRHPGGTAIYLSCAVLSGEPLDLDAGLPLKFSVDDGRVELHLPGSHAVRRWMLLSQGQGSDVRLVPLDEDTAGHRA